MDGLDVVEDSDHLRRALVDPGKYGGNSRRVCQQAGRHAVAGHFKSSACPSSRSNVALRTLVGSRSADECFPSFAPLLVIHVATYSFPDKRIGDSF